MTSDASLPADDRLSHAEALAWALLDEELSPSEFAELELLLSESEEARERYLACVQLHCDLSEYYNPADQGQGQSPILTTLGGLLPGVEGAPQATD